VKSFLTRLASGIILLGIILATGFVGGAVLFVFTLAIALIGYGEFLRVFALEKKLPGVLGMLFVLLYYVGLHMGADQRGMGLFPMTVFLITLMSLYVFTFPRYKTEEIMAALFGFVYVAVMLSFLYQTRTLPVEGRDSSVMYWLIFICSWGCDTCAYVTGMLLGKHRLAPVLSPKKSVEGAIGGVMGAVILGYVYGMFFTAVPAACGIFCGAGAVVSQIGDLAASAIKRNHNIKDYGHLIPGHGGILDRFDSVIFTAPIIYVLAVLFC